MLRFSFRGKSGVEHTIAVADPRLAKIVQRCRELPGEELFRYVDAKGRRQLVSSDDINAYLREITGRDITAKDFRTWAGTVLAALALQELERVDTQAAQKKNLRAAIERVSGRLGNTPSVCRKCYIHPEVLNAYIDGGLALEVKHEAQKELRENLDQLKPEEAAVLALLESRLNRTLADSLQDSLAVAKKTKKKKA
jgi:DNA topoisomerase-1